MFPRTPRSDSTLQDKTILHPTDTLPSSKSTRLVSLPATDHSQPSATRPPHRSRDRISLRVQSIGKSVLSLRPDLLQRAPLFLSCERVPPAANFACRRRFSRHERLRPSLCRRRPCLVAAQRIALSSTQRHTIRTCCFGAASSQAHLLLMLPWHYDALRLAQLACPTRSISTLPVHRLTSH